MHRSLSDRGKLSCSASSQAHIGIEVRSSHRPSIRLRPLANETKRADFEYQVGVHSLSPDHEWRRWIPFP